MTVGDPPGRVRPVAPADAEGWFGLRDELWPGSPAEHRAEIAAFFARSPPREACFVAQDPDGALVGFTEIRLRDVADGCTSSPVGYLEGIHVVASHRRRGIAGALLAAGEAWARERGCVEMASDRDVDNDVSGRFHEAVGFQEVSRAVLYRKDL